ncbi:drug resistance transporter, Bcr/CflA family [Leptospira inadai serovar Lyme str. 10]|uniref:Drug resistance transporter, Bcr/CflA family n=2 Tax=Leptospira inadai serovar Lyme TaxID=293084 RepID=V6H8D8_9LEPT|nr:multidrug effflux MFS transporter [Leptospira inadai]EQA34967.1 drug resistance transporter, Bcr/CflA family [Leptospira inadai serovar Lyme str. 10]PNV75277.1 Bcr/CflA family drug resistance efflux transporter [Leptospira inadai serovar Lyme]
MPKSDRVLILLLGALTAIGPFSIDMYLPGLQSISRDFGTPISNVQLTLTSFFFGFSFGQLVYGPLIDKFGRRTPLMAGLIIYTVSSIGCALSVSVWSLVFFRFLQSLGACAGMVVPRAVIRDVFSPHEGAKVFSQIILVMGIAPIVAPTVGGLLLTYMNWRTIFVVLTIISIIVSAGAWLYLPETGKKDSSISLKLGGVLKEYYEVLYVPRFNAYVIASGLSAAVMFAYIAGSPFVFMGIFGLSESEYGWFFGSNAAGLILASQLNRLLLRKFEAESIVNAISILYVPVGILLVLCATYHWGMIPMIGLIFLLVSGFGFIMPNASALAMAPFSRNAGSASALMGAMQMVAAVVATASVSLLHDGTALPMTLVMSGAGILSLLSLVILRPKAHLNIED